jgi:hypothetical protein
LKNSFYCIFFQSIVKPSNFIFLTAYLFKTSPNQKQMQQKFTKLMSMLLLLVLGNSIQAQVSGTVFQDFNGNGTLDPGELGLPGVQVKAFNVADVQIAAAISASNGTYNLGAATINVAIRIEFTPPSATSCSLGYVPTVFGPSSLTSVQFYAAAASTVANYGIFDKLKFRSANNPDPTMVLTRAHLEDGAPGIDDRDVIVNFNYTKSGDGAEPYYKSPLSKVGALWAVAYNRTRNQIFTAALFKRHTRLGIGGTGGIYITDPLANTTELFTTIPNAGVDQHENGNLFQDRRNIAGSPNSTGLNNPTTAAGTTALGGMDISEDDKTIYVLNLNDKLIYQVDAFTGVVSPTTIAIPATPGTLAEIATGVSRPWALKIYKGKMYVGVVRDASVSNDFNDLKAFVFEYNLCSSTWNTTPIVSVNLNYQRGTVGNTNSQAFPNDQTRIWHPWIKNWIGNSPPVAQDNNAGNGGDGSGNYPEDKFIYPQPILTDIEFDDANAMVLAFSDRVGFQGRRDAVDENGDDPGIGNPYLRPIVGSSDEINGGAIIGRLDLFSGGDVIRVGQCAPNVWTVENNATVCGVTSAGQNGGQGLGGGEFYWGEHALGYNGPNDGYHRETAQGALAINPGTNQTMATTLDPAFNGFQAGVYTNGVITLNNTNGGSENAYEIIQFGDGFNKGNTLGDVEYLQDEGYIQIGNRVWNDANKDGIQNPGEPGIGGVVLELLDEFGNPVDSDPFVPTTQPTYVTTDANGNWYISSEPGTDDIGVQYDVALLPNTKYIIRLATTGPGNDWDETALGGLGGPRAGGDLEKFFISPIVGALGNGEPGFSDNDAALVNSIPQATFITGALGENNFNIDLGFTKLGSISDKVWNDVNGNGLQDAGELGIAGVTVTLRNNSNNTIATTKTDAFGNYIFKDLLTSVTGVNYSVKFSTPVGYEFTTQSGAVTVTNNSDVNANTGITTTVVLTIVNPDVTYVDAGVKITSKVIVGDFVWNDANGNGQQDAGEPGIAGVTVTLYNNSGFAIATVVTDNNGHYQFNDVAPGNYTIGVTPPIGYNITSALQGSSTTDSDIDPITFKTASFTVTNNSITTIDCGLVKQPTTVGSIGDKVWLDLNANGIQDDGEIGVSGITVQLFNSSNTLIATTATDIFGNYIFNNLPPANYYVSFSNIPVGYSITTANVGNDSKDSDVDGTNGLGTTRTYNLLGGQNNVTVDCGLLPPANTYTIGDKVWYDVNKNGLQDGSSTGEIGVPGVTALLFDNAGIQVASTVTDAEGNYLFAGLASGTYSVGFINLPTGYTFTSFDIDATGIIGIENSDVSIATSRTNQVTVNNTNPSATYVDAGLISSPIISQNTKSSLGDKVWNDLNNDGIQDIGEPGIAGITVTLYAANGTTVLAITTTDVLGNYLFNNLSASTYVIGFSNLPTGYVFSNINQGTNSNLDSDADETTGKTVIIVLQSGQSNLTIDAGVHNTVSTATVGDKVWYDINGDGVQDANEQGVPGVSVSLFNNIGLLVATTATDNSGNYLFVDVVPGVYTIGFNNLPSGFKATEKNTVASDAVTGSDANSFTLITDPITILASTTDVDWDLGIVPETGTGAIGNYVWFDANGDGIQDADELPAAGIEVILLDNANNPIAKTVTDGNGFYLFANLPVASGAGTNYNLQFTNLPVGAGFTISGAGTNDVNSDADQLGNVTVTLTTVDPVRLDIDAGIISTYAQVGNYVWYDLNGNGIQDATEPGVPSVLITLYSLGGDNAIGGGDDIVISSAITNGKGNYLINNIPITTCTDFYIQFSAVPGNPFTTQNTGGVGAANNSNANAAGQTEVFQLCPGQSDMTIDAGVRNVPLPVQGLDVTATLNGSVATIKWSTQNEMNSLKFVIERSLDNRTYNAIGETNAAGTFVGISNYSLNNNLNGISNAVVYYRIKAVDIDGAFKYSRVVAVRLSKAEQINVWPVPFSNTITINLSSEIVEKIAVQLFDYTGKLLITNQQLIARGNNQFSINHLEQFAKGVYVLKIISANGNQLLVKKLIKE